MVASRVWFPTYIKGFMVLDASNYALIQVEDQVEDQNAGELYVNIVWCSWHANFLSVPMSRPKDPLRPLI